MKVTSALGQTGYYHSTINEIEKCVFLILLKQFSRRKKFTLKEIQSLVGLLNFACSVIRPG